MKRKTGLLALLLALISLLCAAGFPGSACAAAVQRVKAAPPPVRRFAQTLAAPSVCGALRVKDGKLTDASGRPVQLRGVSTHGIAWFPDYINEECFRQLREEWHVNAVRLAMYTEEYGGYCSGGDREALKALLRKGVSCALAQDLYVILDWHILSDGDPNRHLEDAKAFFDEMSALYAGCPNVLYEICNEPNGGVSWASVKAYAEAVCGVIRARDENAVILVGTPNWCQSLDQAAADPITAYDNLMYTFHFYAATHKEDLRSRLVSALDQGLPVFVSEFGICGASGGGSIDEAQAALWMEVLDRYGVSALAWNLSNKAESSALLRSGCDKTSGFLQEDLSPSGKWLWRTLTSRTEAVPPVPAAAPEASSVPDPAAGEVRASAALVSQWQSGGASFYKYLLTVKNDSAVPCRSWEAAVSFSGPFALLENWNGVFSIDGTSLRIASMDYNGAVPAGGSLEGIGFIVRGGPDLRVTDGG